MSVSHILSVIADADIVYGVGYNVFKIFVIGFTGQLEGAIPGHKVIIHSQHYLPGALSLDGAV